jgi:hypothetical protein
MKVRRRVFFALLHGEPQSRHLLSYCTACIGEVVQFCIAKRSTNQAT